VSARRSEAAPGRDASGLQSMRMAAAGVLAGTERGHYLAQVCDILWPRPASVTAGTRPGRAARAAGPRAASRLPGELQPAGAEYILLLGMRRPRLLIPATPAAAAAAIRGYSALGSRRARLGGRALSLALRSGVGAAALRSRIRVQVPPDADTIESFLSDVLGHDVLVSLYLGPARANRKPVLQVLSPQGQPIGFAKVGVDKLTRTLVQSEAQALARLAQAGLNGLTVPRVMHYGAWREANVLVISALPVWQRRRPVTGEQLAAAMIAVARLAGVRSDALAASPFWQRLTSRLAAADASTARDALQQALSALPPSARDQELAMGSWHGDWTAWNMAATRSGLLVWDWERFTEGVPLGFDALHCSLQHDLVRGGRDPREAVAGCIARAPGLLAPFGVAGDQARLTCILYLAELATRYLADRQAEAGASLGAVGEWLVPAITDEAARLSRRRPPGGGRAV
jgi:hypothetical protein